MAREPDISPTEEKIKELSDELHKILQTLSQEISTYADNNKKDLIMVNIANFISTFMAGVNRNMDIYDTQLKNDNIPLKNIIFSYHEEVDKIVTTLNIAIGNYMNFHGIDSKNAEANPQQPLSSFLNAREALERLAESIDSNFREQHTADNNQEQTALIIKVAGICERAAAIFEELIGKLVADSDGSLVETSTPDYTYGELVAQFDTLLLEGYTPEDLSSRLYKLMSTDINRMVMVVSLDHGGDSATYHRDEPPLSHIADAIGKLTRLQKDMIKILDFTPPSEIRGPNTTLNMTTADTGKQIN